MKLIDTHNHIYLDAFDADRDQMIRDARESGIAKLLLPNVDTDTIRPMLEVCEQYPDFMLPMMGLHPTSVNAGYATALRDTETALAARNYCAIGEIGLDLYWDKTFLKEQKLVFEEQLQWSIDLDLPVAIHTRDAFAEVFDSMYKVGADKLKGVFHSFTGNREELDEACKLSGFMIGINGVVTFKNSGLSDILPTKSIHRIVLETDAPYLAPVPYRGKRNNPVYIWKTAEKIAEIFDLSLDKVIDITSANAVKIFKITN